MSNGEVGRPGGERRHDGTLNFDIRYSKM
jgi:hypothetical protein